ncbi:hypothetical protein GCM10023156_29720 [Novipirellula rosea]|uniref:Uncharacterized protein n=1 Tax=Novipirellula rosea TaxID=1031540 RepID=A0ABP8MVL1_9BACT
MLTVLVLSQPAAVRTLDSRCKHGIALKQEVVKTFGFLGDSSIVMGASETVTDPALDSHQVSKSTHR